MSRPGYPARGIRVRLALRFAGGFAVLLAVGGAALYLWLAREYRAGFERELENAATSARVLFEHDRPEFNSANETVSHLLTELVFVDRVLVAADSTGRLIASSLPYTGGAPLADGLDLRLRARTPVTVNLGAGPSRVIEVALPEGIRLFIAMPLAPLEARLGQLRAALVLGLPLILLLGLLVGFVGSRSALQPVTSLATAAHQIAGEVSEGRSSFSPLPPARAPDELGTLTDALGRLVAQAEQTLASERQQAARQREFLAETAHELRTPLAIIRNEAEVALQGHQASGQDEALRTIQREAASLGELVSDLLALAREAGARAEVRGDRRKVYLDDIAHDAVARARGLPVAAGREIRLGQFDEAPVLANESLVGRAVLALVHNALVHAAPSAVELSTGMSVREGAPCAWLRVRDWGPGIAAADAERVFNRFERLDPRGGGSGLGLVIARQVAEVHGGELRLEQPAGGGVAFVICIPSPTGDGPGPSPA